MRTYRFRIGDGEIREVKADWYMEEPYTLRFFVGRRLIGLRREVARFPLYLSGAEIEEVVE